MIDSYAAEERIAIQEADGIAPSDVYPKGDATLPCEAVQRLMEHRERVLADRAAKKYGTDQSGGGK